METDIQPTGSADLTISLAGELIAGLRFTREEAERAIAEPERWRWAAVGLVLMVQTACLGALKSAGAPEAGNRRRRPGEAAGDDARVLTAPELVAQVGDPAILRPPFTLPVDDADTEAVRRLTAARNRILHVRGPFRLHTTDIARDGLRACRIARFLCLTQPATVAIAAGMTRTDLEEELRRIENALADHLFLCGQGEPFQ